MEGDLTRAVRSDGRTDHRLYAAGRAEKAVLGGRADYCHYLGAQYRRVQRDDDQDGGFRQQAQPQGLSVEV